MCQLKIFTTLRLSTLLRPHKASSIGSLTSFRCISSKIVVTGSINVAPKRHVTNAAIQNGGVCEKDHTAAPIRIQDVVLPEFTEAKNAYKSRKFLEVLRAYSIFRLCAIDSLVHHQDKILKGLQRVLGTTLFRGLMRRTLYGQFLAGESNKEVVMRANREREHGILPMFAYTAAEIHGDIQSSIGAEEVNQLFETNVQAIHNSIDIGAESAKNSDVRAKVSTKLTFLVLPETLRNFNEVIRANIQWLDECKAGNSPKLKEVLKQLTKHLRGRTQDVLIQPPLNRDFLPEDLPSWKKNAAFHLELCQHRNQGGLTLSSDTVDKITTLIRHMNALGKHAAENNVRLIWDAEQTYLQDAMDILVFDSMRRFNQQEPVIANTYQCYLKRQMSSVKRDMDLAGKEGFCLGLKVVRGAYIVEEQRLAKEQGYEDPINPSYDATSQMYYNVAEYILQNVVLGKVKTQTTFATHNLDTVIHIVNRMKAMNITPTGNEIAFAQLVGMRDHITYPLGSVGLPASKLFHYGPVLEGVAYMSRRVQENRGGIGTANLERKMLGKELRRRITLRG